MSTQHPTRSVQPASRQCGFSLVEVMMALTLCSSSLSASCRSA
jgi:prepilin-type N-terminal cleavage/methylation domain-containing protein